MVQYNIIAISACSSGMVNPYLKPSSLYLTIDYADAFVKNKNDP